MAPLRAISQAARRRVLPGACAALLCLSAGGCHRKEPTYSLIPAGDPGSVNNSWANAAKACWPEIQKTGKDDQQIRSYLVHPANLRATFPAYAAMSDADVATELTMPLTMIYPPDPHRLENSATPVLTRGQAVNGVPPGAAVAPHTGPLNTVPPDALCSIQQGLPPGFPQ